MIRTNRLIPYMQLGNFKHVLAYRLCSVASDTMYDVVFNHVGLWPIFFNNLVLPLGTQLYREFELTEEDFK